jgi:hypothetical protein
MSTFFKITTIINLLSLVLLPELNAQNLDQKIKEYEKLAKENPRLLEELKSKKEMAKTAEEVSSGERMPVVVMVSVEPGAKGFRKTYKKGHVNLNMAVTGSKQKQTGTHQLGGTAWFGARPGLGFTVGVDYTPANLINIYTEYYMDRSDFYPPEELPNFVMMQDEKHASRWVIGSRFFLGPWFFLSGHFGMREDFSFSVASTTLGYAYKTWHGYTGFKFGYHLVNYLKFTMDGSLGLDFLFPKTATNFKFNNGLSFNTEMRFIFNYKIPVLTFFRFEYSRLRPDIFTDQSSYYFLLGIGTFISAMPSS